MCLSKVEKAIAVDFDQSNFRQDYQQVSIKELIRYQQGENWSDFKQAAH